MGALPEMFQTTYGSLATGLALQPAQTVLIRGGTSTVGVSAIALAHVLGAHVIATTRNPDHAALLREHGADHAGTDDGEVAAAVRDRHPDGLDAALELVGLDVLPETLRSLRRGGVGCFTGARGGAWTIENFSPFAVINDSNSKCEKRTRTARRPPRNARTARCAARSQSGTGGSRSCPW